MIKIRVNYEGWDDEIQSKISTRNIAGDATHSRLLINKIANEEEYSFHSTLEKGTALNIKQSSRRTISIKKFLTDSIDIKGLSRELGKSKEARAMISSANFQRHNFGKIKKRYISKPLLRYDIFSKSIEFGWQDIHVKNHLYIHFGIPKREARKLTRKYGDVFSKYISYLNKDASASLYIKHTIRKFLKVRTGFRFK